MKIHKNRWYAFGLILLFGLIACNKYYFRSNYRDTNSLIHATSSLPVQPFLKAHIVNGDVCILTNTWKIDNEQKTVSGMGVKYDFNRNLIFEGELIIPIDSVAIFETNTKLNKNESDRIAALSILASADLALGVFCLTTPKACFGSCPTFYLQPDQNFHYADAEGFSNAIAPSMEYFDIDALNNTKIVDGLLNITMKNEALETHCVNDVKLLAVPKKDNQTIYQSARNEFFICENNYLPSLAIADEGDITNLLSTKDLHERFSSADENNLSTKESIVVEFKNVNTKQDLGLVINFRQTLMTTYFIYSAMGYMGDQVGDMFALLETDENIKQQLSGGIKKELGDIDVYLWLENEQKWELQSGLFETGPIAVNQQIIKINNKEKNDNPKFKIVLNKGLWRIDQVALTNIVSTATPLSISPTVIFNKGVADELALNQLIDTAAYLISMPGDAFTMQFQLPEKDTRYELFLYSQGYYLEWMRSHWIKDKDLKMLHTMLLDPKKYLKMEAANYKKYETGMEADFWNSKIDTENFSYYEN